MDGEFLHVLLLFNGYGFRQVAGLVHIQVSAERCVVGDELEHHGDGKYGKAVVQAGYPQMDIGQISADYGIFLGQQDDKGAACLHFPDVGNSFGENVVLGGDGDNRDAVRDQCDDAHHISPVIPYTIREKNDFKASSLHDTLATVVTIIAMTKAHGTK